MSGSGLRAQAGLPALVLPCGEALPEDGGSAAMPVGLQLIGRRAPHTSAAAAASREC